VEQSSSAVWWAKLIVCHGFLCLFLALTDVSGVAVKENDSICNI
jgi:alkyl hydroperoxide reductase subunit AhpF